WGADEIGIEMGYTPKRRVVGPRGQKIQHDQGDANREMVTVMNTICADGTYLKPTVVKSYLLAINISLAVSDNGWFDNELGVEYIRDFDHQTRDGTDDVRFLVVDGHSSHISDGFLDYVREAQDIELACYIPHSTHIYQGLDVGIHGPLKTYFGQERNKLEEEGQVVTKEVYSKAHVKAMTPENIRAVFRKTGIHPFDRSVVTDEMMAPSQETSTAADTVFPTTQPGPV
ncbi:CENP-B protein, partial [Athelia psychrophila]